MRDNNQDKRIQGAPNHGQESREKHFDSLESKRDEEFASELTAADLPLEEDDDAGVAPGTLYGWGSIALAVLSFFIWPIILGAASIVFGFVARSRGTGTLGMIGIVLGVISLLAAFVITPFIT